MPRIFLLLPLLVVAECHFSQLGKENAKINLHLPNAVFSWDVVSTSGSVIYHLFGPICAQTEHISDISLCLQYLYMQDMSPRQTVSAVRGFCRWKVMITCQVWGSFTKSDPTYVYAFHTHLELCRNDCDWCIYHPWFHHFDFPSECERLSLDRSIQHNGSGTDVCDVKFLWGNEECCCLFTTVGKLKNDMK